MMRLSDTPLAMALAVLALLVSFPTTVGAQVGEGQRQGSVAGQVSDGSGGVLPGVTVLARSDDGHFSIAVTDGAGTFQFKGLLAGRVNLRFELDGFDSAVVDVTVQPGAEARVAQRLVVAPVKESVTVLGTKPIVQTPPPVLKPVPSHDLESVCGPAKPSATPESLGTIRSLRYETTRLLYTKGDELLIDGGTLTGLSVGRNLVVGRYYTAGGARGSAKAAVRGEHIAGLVQIVAAEESSSRAVVVYACDELTKGDFVAPFTPEPVRTPEPAGLPVYEEAARILFGDIGQTMGLPRKLMVIDRGGDQGIRPGQRLTLFHQEGDKVSVVGDAVVVAVRSDSATIRVERVADVVAFGDWAAPQRQPAPSSNAAQASLSHP